MQRASKLTYICSISASPSAEDFLRGRARCVCGQPMRERSSHRHDTLSREWRENPGARHLGSLGEGHLRPQKAFFTGPSLDVVRSVTRRCSVTDWTVFGDGLLFALPEGCRSR
ncbi:hypothetical protein [Parabacteroides distasonis]|uniref:hypothetical protein n=1 Tax=Parabacteroides distasonis TaxID=823 RepID=UPI00189C0FE6|nr:hypothetical protein [Parabacteroides distasonis]